MREQDVAAATRFADAVAYGGWPMDVHPPEGFFYDGHPTNFIQLDDIYTIPYRCYYSKNIHNLMMAGRNISATHIAFGSVRVMATCAIGGQAVGTAAALATKYDCSPREVGYNHIEELQQMLLRDDCYIPGIRNNDDKDLALQANITASSWKQEWEPSLVVNGISRTVSTQTNGWRSESLAQSGEWLDVNLEKPAKIAEINIKFDSNLNQAIMISISETIRNLQTPGIPKTLVKNYQIDIFNGEELVYRVEEKENVQRFRKHILPENLVGDRVRITCLSTHGEKYASIYEVRVYDTVMV